MLAINAEFKGCGRVKNGFSGDDAEDTFNLRTLMTNVIVDFCLTFAELAARDGVVAQWKRYVETSAPAGGTPRGRWREEARDALVILQSDEFADKPVRFICEAQMLLEDVYQVRKISCLIAGCHRFPNPTLLFCTTAGSRPHARALQRLPCG
jgi:hypothetical protein